MQKEACSNANGTGSRSHTCNANGSAWGAYSACAPISCNGGYVVDGNACKKSLCTPNETQTLGSCKVANGIGQKGRTCNACDSAWIDFCAAVSCNTGYSPDYNLTKCVQQNCYPGNVQKEACSNANGTGERSRTCLQDGSGWGAYSACKLNACNGGFIAVGNICKQTWFLCTPGEEQSVDCGNGIGIKTRTCNASGSAWSDFSACVIK